MLLVHHVHTCAPVWFLDKYQVNKGQRFQESFRSVFCKLAIEGSPYCRFTGCVITASVSSFWGRFTIQLHKADTVSALRSHTNTHTCTHRLLTPHLSTQKAKTEELEKQTPIYSLVCVSLSFWRGLNECLFHLSTPLGFWHSSWPWHNMQTTVLLQRSVITLIEWGWQVASGLPVDRNPMLSESAHTHTHTLCTNFPLRINYYWTAILDPQPVSRWLTQSTSSSPWVEESRRKPPDQRKVTEV